MKIVCCSKNESCSDDKYLLLQVYIQQKKITNELNWASEIEERKKFHNIDLEDSVIKQINKNKWKEIINCEKESG